MTSQCMCVRALLCRCLDALPERISNATGIKVRTSVSTFSAFSSTDPCSCRDQLYI